VSRVLHEEGWDVTGRFNVRQYLRRTLHHDCRRYVLLQATSPEFLLDAVCHDLGAAALLPATIAVYELADGETAVLVNDFSPSRCRPWLARRGSRIGEPRRSGTRAAGPRARAAAASGASGIGGTRLLMRIRAKRPEQRPESHRNFFRQMCRGSGRVAESAPSIQRVTHLERKHLHTIQNGVRGV
jgi:hypothetical protein